ncbi:MAG: ABC transporter ATP-binding protein [Gammaproteobacteria bacterium]|nr:ABC transporter ATP-binding protein [Gammaproteobacteria bacterium]
MSVTAPRFSSSDPVLRVQGLQVSFFTERGELRVVDDVSFDIAPGETLALVGESGSGKTVTALALMGLIDPPGRIVQGQIELKGQALSGLSETQMQQLRGRRIGMIFQEPMTSLNPVFTIGDQIGEVLLRHLAVDAAAARTQVLKLLDEVGIPDASQRIDRYPHELSGGMKQRVMIAMAIACQPDLLIADEPTTALDVTIQAQILALLKELQRKTGMAMLFITHDLGIVSDIAERVAVMYAGQIVELAPRATFFTDPQHPYSQKLFRALPNRGKRGAPLEAMSFYRALRSSLGAMQEPIAAMD